MFTGGFQSFAFQSISSGVAAIVTVAGRVKKQARALTRQKHRAHVLAEKYNKAREYNQTAAVLHIAATVEQFTPEDKREPLPPTAVIDFEALAANRAATQAFLAAIEKVKQAIDAEEMEIFHFMSVIA